VRVNPTNKRYQVGPTTSWLSNLPSRASRLYLNPSNSNPAKKLPSIMSVSNGDRLIIFDTGALIQLHTQEHFSPLSKQVYSQANQIGMCYLVLPEIAGATGAMMRGKRLSKKQRSQIQDFVTGNLQYWLILPVSKRVCDLAFNLCQKHPLKGADAIHLAAAKILLLFRPKLTFFTIDKTLYQTAKKEKIPVATVPEFESGR